MLLAAVAGGVFALSQITFGVSNARDASNQIVVLATGAKRLGPASADSLAVVADLITAKLAPADIIDNSTSPATLKTPWGTDYTFGRMSHRIYVEVPGVPLEECALMARSVNGPGFAGAWRAFTEMYTSFPPNNTEAANLCDYTGTDTLWFVFE